MNTLKIIEAIRKWLGLRSSELFSEKFYDQLNYDIDNLNDYNKECDKLNEPYNTPGVKNICKHVLKYLETKSFKLDDENSVRDDCVLLNYWVYDKLSKLYGSSGSADVPHAYGTLQSHWYSLVENSNNTSYFRKCKPSDTIVTESNRENKKELFEYCVDYETARKLADYYNKCEDYYPYFQKKVKLFEFFEGACASKTNDCPAFYEKCKEHDPRKFLHQLSCHNKMKDIKEPAALPRLLPESGEGKEEGPPEADDKYSSPMPTGEVPSPLAATLRGRIPNTPIKYGDLLLGVVVTSITSGVLYRFKPYRRRLRNGFGWNSTPISTLNEGGNGLLAQVLDAHNPLSGDGAEHFIGYTPV
ncbi:variable surface protein Vir4 [Plasmodium vivax Mauritania I]|uniref:Variable surface protein Vir4 n=1 Tax=Plasmodium vivax Mauritania I TaxID=1035515 RepID=A0A0J9TJF8_PLAVI|nr:variable surface protein Vir4 [Plasmodium vivax Mauritania I]